MTGKGRHHEGIAADQGNWLEGMSFRRSEMCNTIQFNTHCPHFNSQRGCGYAHTVEEMTKCRDARI
eukprot:3065189-Heterocapsa_arctica.AAC.1